MSEKSYPYSFIRLSEVQKRVSLSRSTIYSLIAKGEFPSGISLGARAVGYVDTEIDSWMASRIAATRQATVGVQ